jgi:glycosyltransferase involved in cell wall biosynthesis
MDKQLMIHATNISGLGACQVVKSLITSLIKQFKDQKIELYLPLKDSIFEPGETRELDSIKVHRLKRFLPNSLSRVSESFLSPLYFKKTERSIILGDLPLRGFDNQVVLVHQPNLISPKINPYSGRNIKYRIARWIFKSNLKFVKHIVVQTGVMKEQIIASYPELTDRVTIIPQPAPVWFNRRMINRKLQEDSITLFYPANNYPHKNFKIFEAMNDFVNQIEFPVRVIITLNSTEISPSIAKLNWLKCVGRLTPEECLKQYEQVTALFFPSLLESYGLPLVESMTAGLPIICSDLPYARWLCEDQAIYFDPLSAKSACEAIDELHRRMADKWQVNWKQALAKIPNSWDEVANKFIDLLCQ